MYYKIDPDLLVRIVATLKQIDVRGYESMDRLVGLVMMLEHMLSTEPMKESADEGEEDG